MSIVKTTELSQANVAAANDLLVIVSSPDVLAETKKIKVSGLFSNIVAGNVYAQTMVVQDTRTPSNSTITVQQGTIFFDNTYVYIAVSNNNIKRIALESF